MYKLCKGFAPKNFIGILDSGPIASYDLRHQFDFRLCILDI